MRSSLFLATALAATLAAGAARADDFLTGRHVGALEPRAGGSRIGLTTDLWPTQDSFVTAMGITGQIEVTRGFVLDFDLPWIVGSFPSGIGSRTTRAAFGSVTVGGHGVIPIGHDAAINVGATVSIPTRYNFEGDGLVQAFVLAAGDATHAYYDLHRLYPGVVFIRVPIGAEVRFAKIFRYRGELNPSILIPAGEGFKKDPHVLLEHADELEARAPFGLGGGLRFQAVFALSNFGGTGTSGGFGGGDRAQTALEPFLQYEPRGSGVYARLGLLVALDSPAGFGFERNKLATIRIGVGGKF